MQAREYLASSRFIVFLAVACSVTAVAWAIRDPLLFVIGISGLAAGHFYSWLRHDSLSRLRMLILIVLMVLLTIYLGADMLFSGIGDRLLLARYLAYGLVLGSFDLTRRRNVLSCLVLGGLLLVLVSEFALDWSFLAFAVIFTILSLAAAAVDRVETEGKKSVLVGKSGWSSAGRASLAFAAFTMLVSAVLFLAMPRIGRGQMAQASWLPSRLDLTLGGLAMLPSRPSASPSPGILPSQADGTRGSGEYAVLGYAGSSADRPVLHVRSQISSYWRGMTFDKYDGRGWLSSSPDLRVLSESRGEFVLPDSRLNMADESVYWQTYFVLSDQPNAVFTGYNPGRIYLPQMTQTYLEQGALYRALSVVPRLRPESLRADRAFSEDPSDLALPAITQRTAALAESIVQGAPTDYDKAARLERFLLTNYTYNLDTPPLPAGQDAVDFFLFEQQSGYCSQFASAMAVMARHVGLPARIAAGYLPGVIDPMTGAHVVRTGDAHAWVEIHFRRNGWVAFDPTPRPDAALGFAARRNLVYFGLDGFTGVSLSGTISPMLGKLSLATLLKPAWLLFIGLIVVAIVSAVLIGRRQTKTRREIGGYTALEGESRQAMLRLYHKMAALLARKGLGAREPYQPPVEYAASVCPNLVAGQEEMDWLTEAAARAAYDARDFPPELLPLARARLSALRTALGRRQP